MGPRTLQRRLKDQGVEFKALVDDTRRLFALPYLRNRNHTLAEIAYLLGYSEVSAFNRAFRRWTGSTPSDYRRRASPLSSGTASQVSSAQTAVGSCRRRSRWSEPSRSSITSGARGYEL